MADVFNIAGRIHSTSQEEVVTTTNEILDATQEKKQNEVNQEVSEELALHTNRLNALTGQNYITVQATQSTTAADIPTLINASGEGEQADTLYRVGFWDGSAYVADKYTEYAWNGTAYVILDVKSSIGEVFDISQYNAVGGTLATYADLAAALSGTNVPASVRRGGMSIKFVQSYDNKYMQYFLTKDSWSTSEADWEKMNLEEEVSLLGQKVTELSSEEATDLEEEIKITTEDGQTTLIVITPNGVNAHNLKLDGQDVLTRQDISTLATKTELADGLAEKQDVIEEISIDDTQDDETSEHIWASDDGAEEYAKVNPYGFFAKNSYLYGKKWAVLGDSFTAGDGVGTFPDGKYAGKPKTYPYLISLRTGIELYNFFGGGRTLAFPAIPGDFVNSVTNPTRDFYYQNIPSDTDIITIYLGINDSHHRPGSGGGDGEDNTGEIPLGTISDNNTSTFYGAWNVVLSWLIENRPFAHIGIIVSNGCETIDYRTATLEIAQKYGIPYIDLNGDERTPFMLRAKNTNIPGTIQTIRIQKQAVDYDGTITGTQNWHPNEDAHLFESTFIESFLRTI